MTIPSPNPRLRLPIAPETALFRETERVLRSDGTLDSVVKTWRSFEGAPADKADPSLAQCPWVRLSTQAGALQFFAPSTMEGRLELVVELAVAGTCLDDLHNLWNAFQRALYPTDATARLATQARLITAGARTGQWAFSQVAFDPTPGVEGLLMGRGVMATAYRFDVNPTAPTC